MAKCKSAFEKLKERAQSGDPESQYILAITMVKALGRIIKNLFTGIGLPLNSPTVKRNIFLVLAIKMVTAFRKTNE